MKLIIFKRKVNNERFCLGFSLKTDKEAYSAVKFNMDAYKQAYVLTGTEEDKNIKFNAFDGIGYDDKNFKYIRTKAKLLSLKYKKKVKYEVYYLEPK